MKGRAVLLGIAFLASSASYAGDVLVVKRGDTPSALAAKYCGGAENWRKVWSGDPRRLPAGKKITLDAECNARRAASSTVVQSPREESGVREFRHIGGDPLLTGSERRRSFYGLHPKQETRLRAWGWSSPAISALKVNIAIGKCRFATRRNGYQWDGMSFGSGGWGKTVAAVKSGAVDVIACPSVGGQQVDIIPDCGNVARSFVKKQAPPVRTPPSQTPPAVQEARREGCLAEGTLWGEVGFGDMKGVAGSAEAACLYDVGGGYQVGPVGRISGGHYHPEGWTEEQSFVGGGVRIRNDNSGFWDRRKADFMFGIGSAQGRSDDGSVRKKRSSGLDAWIALQGEKVQETNDYNILHQATIFGQIPLSGKGSDITWKGEKVARDGRHAVAGIHYRAGFDRKGSKSAVVPEVTVAGWNTFGVENGLGGKVVVGVASRDRSRRIGVGVKFGEGGAAGPIIEAEYNWGQVALGKAAEENRRALTNGATSSADALGVDAPRVTLDSLEKAKPVVIPASHRKSVAKAEKPRMSAFENFRQASMYD